MSKSRLLLSILAALPACHTSYEGKGCMEVSAERACPAAKDVQPSQLFLPGECGDDLEIDEVLGGPTRETLSFDDGSQHDACCYAVEVIDSAPNSSCVVGRPYLEAGRARRAPLLSAGSNPRERSARAEAWARAGAEEHASVAAFSRLALQLLALGAPPELLGAVHRAALEEVGHAERCWALAARFGAGSLAPGRFPFAEGVALDVSLADLAAAAVREGCLGETLGAHVAALAAELAEEPDVKAALAAIAAEEEAHAVLSYRLVAWALAAGGPEVRAAVVAAFVAGPEALDVAELALRANVDAEELRRGARQAVQDVLAPARERLLAS
jgi:hypothetical protein